MARQSVFHILINTLYQKIGFGVQKFQAISWVEILNRFPESKYSLTKQTKLRFSGRETITGETK